MKLEQVLIVWNGAGGELDRRVVTEAPHSNGLRTSEALRAMLDGNHLNPGDTIVVTSIDEEGVF